MKIALLGYGKMGKAIDKIAQERGHEITFKISTDNIEKRELICSENTDVVIEFSVPHLAYENLKFCMERGLKTVSGTTGWLDHKVEIDQLCKDNATAFFYASNYSIGVNLFFKLNAFLAKLMTSQSQYSLITNEIHHTEKLDSPSGTAITIAEEIIKAQLGKQKWVNNQIPQANEVSIWSQREGKVPGTHSVKYLSEIDEIFIQHAAYSRQGFALGAVLAAEWLKDKTGILGMEQMLTL